MISSGLTEGFIALNVKDKKRRHVKFDILLSVLSRKEGNVLFNDALNTLYLRLYGLSQMVKDHSNSERGKPLPPHGLLFPISS